MANRLSGTVLAIHACDLGSNPNLSTLILFYDHILRT